MVGAQCRTAHCAQQAADHLRGLAVALVADLDLGGGYRNDFYGLGFLLGIDLAGIENISLVLLASGLAASDDNGQREYSQILLEHHGCSFGP
ncbi:hypothetical protein D3C81_1770110 [compost metagenome]